MTDSPVLAAADAQPSAPSASRGALAWRTLSAFATRAALAATVSGSIAVFLSSDLAPRRAAEVLEAERAARPAAVQQPQPAVATATKAANEATSTVERPEAEVVRERLFAAVSRCRPTLNRSERARIAEAIHQEAERHGYDPMFVMAMVEVESTCSPTANSPRGAVGLTQLRPSTAKAVAKEVGVPWQGRTTLVHPVLNVRLGLSYLTQLLEQFGDPYLAMAAYNMGPTRVSSMPKHRARGSRYVKKILARYQGLLDEHA